MLILIFKRIAIFLIGVAVGAIIMKRVLEK